MEQKQIVSKLVNEESKILRECHSRRLALLDRVFKRCFDDTPSYVESETNSDKFYYLKIVYESSANFWCSCQDFASHLSDKCKHLYALEYAIKLNLVQTVDKKLPIVQKPVKPKSIADQYKEYSIVTLNELEKAEIEAEQYKRQHSWEDDTYDFQVGWR